ncbi:MAG: hypothetical protein JNL25_07465, partial [Rhodospirillaceae bacterium]|nr:hypothetical protein [Rhodospirillaceae bacterium]
EGRAGIAVPFGGKAAQEPGREVPGLVSQHGGAGSAVKGEASRKRGMLARDGCLLGARIALRDDEGDAECRQNDARRAGPGETPTWEQKPWEQTSLHIVLDLSPSGAIFRVW